MGHFHMVEVWLDEEADGDAAFMKKLDDLLHPVPLADDIQPSLRGEFLPMFWDQSDEVRLYSQGDFRDRVLRRHFKVQFGFDDLLEQGQITVLNVTPIFPQMYDDAVRARELGQYGRFNWVRFTAPAGLTERCHMIDIDS
jgi:hypothetical protein